MLISVQIKYAPKKICKIYMICVLPITIKTSVFKFISRVNIVYKIPIVARRAWPSGCIGRVRRTSKGIVHTRINIVQCPFNGLVR